MPLLLLVKTGIICFKESGEIASASSIIEELETMDPSLAWAVDFFQGDENWVVRDTAYHTRGFAVLSRK